MEIRLASTWGGGVYKTVYIMQDTFMSDRFLNDCWSLHFHDPDDSDWSETSYKLLSTVSTVQDWQMSDTAFKDLWQKGMFFLMREHIKPLWEDPHNKDGGCLSFKVNKPDAGGFWYKLGALALGDSLTKNLEQFDRICGVSISPKRNYCILRVWVSTSEISHVNMLNLAVPEYTQVIYKSHKDNSDYVDKT